CKEQIKLFTGGYVNNSNERFLSTKGSEKNHFVKAGYVCPFFESPCQNAISPETVSSQTIKGR
ncbi:hypothetical protein P9210_13400, partial [Heyndrickxia coagulans]|nr:hypothetical protein [Heyndrickxia coagulans]